MSEKLNIQCPSCGETFPLDETLAGPMVAQVRADTDRQLAAVRREAEDKVKALVAMDQRMCAEIHLRKVT
jgi:hypothetical protein